METAAELYARWQREAREYWERTNPPRKNEDGTLRPPPSQFCFTPEECAGRTSCPRRIACTE